MVVRFCNGLTKFNFSIIKRIRNVLLCWSQGCIGSNYTPTYRLFSSIQIISWSSAHVCKYGAPTNSVWWSSYFVRWWAEVENPHNPSTVYITCIELWYPYLGKYSIKRIYFIRESSMGGLTQTKLFVTLFQKYQKWSQRAPKYPK